MKLYLILYKMTNITIAEFDNDVMADLDNDTFISIVEPIIKSKQSPLLWYIHHSDTMTRDTKQNSVEVSCLEKLWEWRATAALPVNKYALMISLDLTFTFAISEEIPCFHFTVISFGVLELFQSLKELFHHWDFNIIVLRSPF